MSTTVRFAYEDFEAEKASLGIHLLTVGTETVAELQARVSALEAVLAPCTCAGVLRGSIALDADVLPIAATNDSGTPNAEDKAILEFASERLSVTFSIPAPVDSIFDADKETVDPLDAAIAALILAVISVAADKANNAIITFIRGWRARR